jgi:hypothetical protein
MIRLPDWLSPKTRRLSPSPEADDTRHAQDRPPPSPGFSSAMNTGSAVIDLVRPHLFAPDCLIVTGYQDFLSSLSIVMREVPDIALYEDRSIRIAFGVNTGNSDGFAGATSQFPRPPYSTS